MKDCIITLKGKFIIVKTLQVKIKFKHLLGYKGIVNMKT